MDEMRIAESLQAVGGGENVNWTAVAREALRVLGCAELEAECFRLRGIIKSGIAESVANAPLWMEEDGIRIEHFAVRALAASFRDTLGEAPNCIELTVTPEGDDAGALVVTVQRRSGKTPLELKSEAEAARHAAEQNASKKSKALADALRLLKRYRDETPIGHQPNMLASAADDILYWNGY